MCRTYRAMEITPIVRITNPDPFEATCMIDGGFLFIFYFWLFLFFFSEKKTGACGIIAPYVETVEQVKQLRGAVKLRPLKVKKTNT